MSECGELYDETNLVEYMADALGFSALSEALPGRNIYPPYLFVGFFLLLDHAVLQVYVHLNGGTHVLIDFPNIVVGPVAVLFAVYGIRCMSNGYADALSAIRIPDRAEEADVDRFRRTVSWRTKVVVYVVAVVVLYANVVLNVGLSNLVREGGGGITLINWLFTFEFVYLPVIVEFALTYYGIQFLLPRRLDSADIGLFFYDPRNMGGFAAVGQLLKRSYYLYTAGLLLFFVVVYGGVLLSFGGTPAGRFELVFFSTAWLVGLASIGYSMYTVHQIMSERKERRIRELEDEMHDVIENPYDINSSAVADEARLDDIRRRLEEVRSTRVYPATFTMWSQIAVSVLLPQALQLTVQTVA